VTGDIFHGQKMLYAGGEVHPPHPLGSATDYLKKHFPEQSTAMLVWKCLHDAAPRYLALLRMSPGPGTDYTNGPPITRTVARFVQAPAQDPLVCSGTRQCWLQLWVSCTVVPSALL